MKNIPKWLVERAAARDPRLSGVGVANRNASDDRLEAPPIDATANRRGLDADAASEAIRGNLKLCLACGIAKDAVAFASADVCTNCHHDLEMSQAVQLRLHLSFGENYSGSGLYAASFDTGTKFGIASCIRNRVKDYKHAWCRPLERVSVLAAPKMLLRDLERTALERFTPVRKRGEYVFRASQSEIISTFEHICAAFYPELVEHSRNWRD